MCRLIFCVLVLLGSGPIYASCTLPTDHQQYINIVNCGASTANSDNSAYINAALAAAFASGVAANQYPGIYIPPGVFLTSGGHTPGSGIGIFGSGVLKLTATSSNPVIDTTSANNAITGVAFDLSASTSASRIAIDIDGGSTGTVVTKVSTMDGRIIALVTNNGSAPTEIAIRNSTLVSPKVGGTSGGGLEINSEAAHFTVSGNRISSSDGAGIAIQSGSQYGTVVDNDTYSNAGSGIYAHSGLDISIAHNQCSSNGQSGIGLNTGNSPSPGRLSVVGNVCTHNAYDGIDLGQREGGTQFLYIELLGNYLESNGTPSTGGTGINLENAANVVISGNTMFNNGTAGLFLNASQNIAVNGNIISNDSQDGSSACSGFGVPACPGIMVYNSTSNTFGANISTNNGGTPSQSYGIEEVGTSDYNTYAGNNTQDNISGGLSLVGSHDTQAANL